MAGAVPAIRGLIVQSISKPADKILECQRRPCAACFGIGLIEGPFARKARQCGYAGGWPEAETVAMVETGHVIGISLVKTVLCLLGMGQ